MNKVISPAVVVENFLTPEQCDEIIKIGSTIKPIKEEFGDDEGRYSFFSMITPCMFEHIYKDMHNKIHVINKKHFGYALTPKKQWEHGAFFKYPKDGFTAWHYDGYFGKEYGDRKLSAVIMLSEGEKDYQGGHFELPHYMHHEVNMGVLRKKGSLIVFPSFLFHQVTKVTEGDRYTLAYFFKGPHFV